MRNCWRESATVRPTISRKSSDGTSPMSSPSFIATRATRTGLRIWRRRRSSKRGGRWIGSTDGCRFNTGSAGLPSPNILCPPSHPGSKLPNPRQRHPETKEDEALQPANHAGRALQKRRNCALIRQPMKLASSRSASVSLIFAGTLILAWASAFGQSLPASLPGALVLTEKARATSWSQRGP